MILEAQLGKEAAASLARDPVLFVKAFDRRPWQFQQTILRQALARHGNGKFKHKVVVVSMPRQNSKSTLSAWAALWRLYCDENQEVISVANDRSQAGIILNDARRIIRNSEVLYKALDGRWGLTKSEIHLKNGNGWMIKSADAVFSRGLRPGTICYDELGWAPDRELFDVLSAGQAAQPNPLILVTSTVGPVKAGILWELFELARAGDPSTLLIYHTENLSPLVTEEYLERERALLPPAVFSREHLNLWSEGSDVYCTEQDWQRATSDGDPRRLDDPGPAFAFVDLGWAHDETAIAAVKRNHGKTAVLALDIFQGSQAHPVKFDAVEKKLAELAERLHIRRMVIESPQGVAMAQRLSIQGVNTQVLYPTAKSNQEHWGALYTALKSGLVMLPDDAKLRRQLLTLTIKNTPTGWKLEDVPSIHQDRARAIAGAVHLAGAGLYTPLPEDQPTQVSKWIPNPEDLPAGWTRKY